MKLKETVSLWRKLREAKKPIVLYGMGDGADKILNELERRKINAAGVFASDEFCRGQLFRGFDVMNYAQAKERFGEMVVLVAFGTQRPEIIDRIKRIASQQETYAPDVPLAGGEAVFDGTFLQENMDRLQAVYDLLGDELSKRTFTDMIDYKLSGKLEYLFDCESSADEAYRNLLRLGDNEFYVDAGAYTGDTVTEFLQYAGSYRGIAAIEPDEKNFARLKKNTQGIHGLALHHCAAYDKDTEISFDTRGGRNSAIRKKGKPVRARRIDDILAGKAATYIKLDVEGQEAAALWGARKTIANYKPKLLVSAYHRNDDLFCIPQLIAGIRGDYKVFLRHFPYIPAWDTNYYFV